MRRGQGLSGWRPAVPPPQVSRAGQECAQAAGRRASPRRGGVGLRDLQAPCAGPGPCSDSKMSGVTAHCSGKNSPGSAGGLLKVRLLRHPAPPRCRPRTCSPERASEPPQVTEQAGSRRGASTLASASLPAPPQHRGPPQGPSGWARSPWHRDFTSPLWTTAALFA